MFKMGLGCVPNVQDIFPSSAFSIRSFKIIKMYKIQLPIPKN